MWKEMYEKAKRVQNQRSISPFIDAGAVAAALLTDKGNIYVGVCIDMSSSLGMCAERNAIANMITNGENKIVKILAITPDGKVAPPCGACREFLMQLGKESKNIEVLMDYEAKKSITLEKLCPNWWTDSRYYNENR